MSQVRYSIQARRYRLASPALSATIAQARSRPSAPNLMGGSSCETISAFRASVNFPDFTRKA
jgi:hypothetical protein